MSFDPARDQTFSWSTLKTAFGSADSMVEELISASHQADVLDALDGIQYATRFVLDSGVLNAGCVEFADLLMEHATAKRRVGSPVWPFLRGVIDMLSVSAFYGDVRGISPSEGSFAAAGTRGVAEQIFLEMHQNQHVACITETVASHSEFFIEIAEHGSGADRAQAAALLVLIGPLSGRAGSAIVRGATMETNPRTRASLILSCHYGGFESEMNRALVRQARESKDASTVAVLATSMDVGSAHSGMWSDDEAFAAIRERFADHTALSSSHSFDFAWFDGSVESAVMDALSRSTVSRERKKLLLWEALQSEPNRDGILPDRGVAPTAAWFYMRLLLARHYNRAEPLGPEDLHDDERFALNDLRLTARNWISGGVGHLGRFGMCDIHDLELGLLDPNSPLAQIVSGRWAGSIRSCSRWKWLRRPHFETPAFSEYRAAALRESALIATRGLDWTALLELLCSVAPFAGLDLDELLTRAINRALAEPVLASTAAAACLDRGLKTAGHARHQSLVDTLALLVGLPSTKPELEQLRERLRGLLK